MDYVVMANYCDSPDSDRFNAGFASFCKLSDCFSAAFMFNAVNCVLLWQKNGVGATHMSENEVLQQCTSPWWCLLILMSVADEPLGMNLHGRPRCCSMTPNAHITVWGNGFQINIMAVNKQSHLWFCFVFQPAICATSFGSDMTTVWWGVCLLKVYFCLNVQPSLPWEVGLSCGGPGMSGVNFDTWWDSCQRDICRAHSEECSDDMQRLS